MYKLLNMTGSRVIAILHFINFQRPRFIYFQKQFKKYHMPNPRFINIVIFLDPKLSLALFSGSPGSPFFAFAHCPTITILFAFLIVVRIMLAVKSRTPEGCVSNPCTI